MSGCFGGDGDALVAVFAGAVDHHHLRLWYWQIFRCLESGCSVQKVGTTASSQTKMTDILHFRMATQLGLRDLVQGDRSDKLFTVPPRMLTAPRNSIEREERVRAYRMTEALDGYSTLGASWNLHLLRPPLTEVLPCNDDDWKCTEPMVDFLTFGDFESPFSFALYVSFVTNELFEVHRFLQQSFQTTTSEECETGDLEFRRVEGYLNDWRARNASIAGLFASYVTTPGRTVRFDPTIVPANTGYNM